MAIKRISYDEQRNCFIVSFPYTPGLVIAVKTLADRHWDPDNKVWTVPASMPHAKMMMEFAKEYSFAFDPQVMQIADEGLPKPDKKVLSVKGLRDFQKTAVRFFLEANGRAICGDEMGLGKTIEAIAYAKSISASPVLVVCPASVMWKWVDEIHKWSNYTPTVVETGKSPIPAGLVIMSYSMMAIRYNELMKTQWGLIIYDEVHNLSNFKSNRYRAAKMIPGRSIIGLSGTPFLNRPIELWPILNLLDPITWGNRWKYATRYCNAIRTRFGWDVSGSSNLDELSNKVSTLMIRRTKQDVLTELPKLTRELIPVTVSMTEYKKGMKLLYGKAKPLAIVELGKMKHYLGMQKVEPAVELAENILSEGRKVVLYAHHRDVVSLLEAKLKQYGVVTIVGDLDAKTRQANTKTFQQDPNTRVIIISSAGGEGIDLFAASDLVFVEREWNPGKEEQAEARTHRIGQEEPVTAYYLVAKGTFDEKVAKLIDTKREVFKGVIGSDDIETTILDSILIGG